MGAELGNYPCETCSCVDGVSAVYTWRIPGVVERTNRCLRKQITGRSVFFLELHRHYLNGVLPVSGGLLDQPYVFHRAMTVIEAWRKRG